MANLIRIKQDKAIKLNQKILNYLNPDFVYIPIEKGFELKIKTNDQINKEGILLQKNNQYIYSPISGKVIGACNIQVGNKKTKGIVVENDFCEKTPKISGIKRYINNYSKEEALSLIKEFNAYHGNFKGNSMVINGIDAEPYVLTNSYIIGKYTNEILETIDALSTIFELHRSYFAIKNNDTENVHQLVHHIGTYPNINLKLMADLYPIGDKKILINSLISSRKQQGGVIYLTVSEIYAIYNVLKRKRPITEVIITVTGDMLDEAKVLNVKVGTSLKDILENNFKIKAGEYKIVINGLMGGYEINTLDFVINPNITAIFITSLPKTFKKKCINCGMCHTKCPYGCDPRSNYRMENCTDCGICSYVCPANVNFRKKGDK